MFPLIKRHRKGGYYPPTQARSKNGLPKQSVLSGYIVNSYTFDNNNGKGHKI